MPALYYEIVFGDIAWSSHKEHAAVPPESCAVCVTGNQNLVTQRLIAAPRDVLEAKTRVDSFLPTFPDLLDNLASVFRCEASDPRDLIYACLGYSSNSYGIEPDYALRNTLSDVSCQLARNVINSQDYLNILELATVSAYSHRLDFEYPSWIPD
jgi:hypothetical protein